MSKSFTKQQLIAAVARDVGESQDHVREVLDTAMSRITAELARGNRVEVRGFGIFSVRTRAARRGVNPMTGESMNLAARRTVNFRVGTTLRRALDGSGTLRELKSLGLRVEEEAAKSA